jgi:hypothetical protein
MSHDIALRTTPSRSRSRQCAVLAFLLLTGGLARVGASGPGSIEHSFTFTESQVSIRPGCEYDIVSCAGAEEDRHPARIGSPALPVLTCHFVLPPGTSVADLQVTVRSSLELAGTYTIPPVSNETGESLSPDPDVYASWEPYPSTPAILTAAGTMKGYNLATVQLWPLQYIPAEARLILLTGIDISIATQPLTFADQQALFVPLREDWEPRQYRPEVQWMSRHLLNPEDLPTFYGRPSDPTLAAGGGRQVRPFGGFVPTEFPSLEGPPVSMVMLTDDQRLDGGAVPGMTAAFQDWANWKTSTGVPTVVRTVSWVDANYTGVDRPEKIRNFLKDAAALWGTDFVLLGGDLDIVPARLQGGPETTQLDGPQAGDDAADKYYAELDQNWNLNGNAYFAESGLGQYDAGDDIVGTGLGGYVDLWIGRLPVRNATEASRVIAKIATYVSRPGYAAPSSKDPSFYSHILLAAGTNGDWCSLDLVADVDAIRGEILAQSPYFSGMTISRMYPDLPVAVNCPQAGAAVRCLKAHYDAMGGVPPDRPYLASEFESALSNGIGGKPVGYVLHFEHSSRDMLGMQHGDENHLINDFVDPVLPGDLPGCGACRSLEDPTQTDPVWLATCAQLLRASLPAGWKDDFTKERADRLRNAPDFFIATSAGCHVNRYERDAVGEHLLRNPAGGAVAFLGSSPYSGLDASKRFLECTFVDGIEPVGAASGLAVSGWDLRYALGYALLGDPQMPLLTMTPRDITATISPARFGRLGPQTFAVTVQDKTTQARVAGARVCLKQSDLAYAVAWTGLDGVATFTAYAPMSMDVNVTGVITAQNHRPTEITAKPISVAPTPAYVAYAEHTVEDNIPGGNGDGIIGAGEAAGIRVTAKNMGSSSALGVEGHLWVTAPVVFDLDIAGDPDDPGYEPENIFIGALGAHPHPYRPGEAGTSHSNAGETFRLPGNCEAIRAEGVPQVVGPTRSRVLVWRDNDAVWHVRTHPTLGDADMAFEGVLETEGGFDDVRTVNTELGGGAADLFEFDPNTDPNRIHFQFQGAGDDTPDEVCFRAEAHLWMAVDPSVTSLGNLPGGATVSGLLGIRTTPLAPDQHELVFTLAAEDAAHAWSYSDFSETLHAPDVRYLAQGTESGLISGSAWIRIWPQLANLGSAGMSAAEVRLHPVWPLEFLQMTAVATFGPIAADDIGVVAEPLYVEYEGVNWIPSLRYDLEIRAQYPTGDSQVFWQRGLDVLPPAAPVAVAVDEAGGAVVLRWEPVADPDVAGYHVHQYLAGVAHRLTLTAVTGTTRYEVSGLAALDPQNQCIEYQYAVTSIDAAGNESQATLADLARPWLPEVPGWPKHILGGSDCAPKVYDVDGDGDLEIIAAGGAIYAWHHSGQPLIAGNTDGSFYVPPNEQFPSSSKFVTALAVGMLDRNNNPEVVGNLTPAGVVVLEYNRSAGPGINPVTLKWNRAVRSYKSAPMIEDVDQIDGKREVIIAGNESDNYLYIWTSEGRTFRDPALGTNGRFTRILGGQEWCYQSLSVGDISASFTGMEIVQALPNGKVVGYRTDSWSPMTPLTCLLSAQSKNKPLSTPIPGDVDGDGQLEIVTTRVRDEGAGVLGGIWSVGLDGNTEWWVAPETNPYRFTGDPPAPAVLVDLDVDGDLDIVAGGGRHGDAGLGLPGEEPWASILRLHMMLGGSPLDTLTVDDQVMLPGRREFSTAAANQPVVADIDGDGRLEIIFPTDGDYLACFEWNNATRTARPERGWPVLFGDTPLSPIIANVDPTTSNLEMVVQDRTGAVHLFKLPGPALGARIPWSQYGFDTRNTFCPRPNSPGDGGEGGDGPGAGPVVLLSPRDPADFELRPMAPSVVHGSFAMNQPGAARVDVFDVQGRCVRVLLDGSLPAGRHDFDWDGRAADGHRAASGVYLVRLSAPDRTVVRRISIAR